jgi:hypothetical protein
MRPKTIVNPWHKTFVRILKNPTFEVLAAIVVVLLATWVVVQTEVDLRQRPAPAQFGHK